MFSFLNQEDFQLKPKKISKPRPICHICGQSFKTPRSASDHVVFHTDNGYFNCIACPEKFTAYNSLVWHLHTHDKSEVPNCPKCGHFYPSRNVLSIHCCVNMGGSPLQCDKCYISFDDVTAFSQDHLCITDDNLFTCPCCDSKYENREKFGGHLSRHLNKGYFVCKVCDRRFALKKSLDNHKRTHKNREAITCKLCGKNFFSDSAIVRHGLQVHGPKTFKCQECDKVFSMKSGLRRHVVLKHTRDRMLCGVTRVTKKVESAQLGVCNMKVHKHSDQAMVVSGGKGQDHDEGDEDTTTDLLVGNHESVADNTTSGISESSAYTNTSLNSDQLSSSALNCETTLGTIIHEQSTNVDHSSPIAMINTFGRIQAGKQARLITTKPASKRGLTFVTSAGRQVFFHDSEASINDPVIVLSDVAKATKANSHFSSSLKDFRAAGNGKVLSTEKCVEMNENGAAKDRKSDEVVKDRSWVKGKSSTSCSPVKREKFKTLPIFYYSQRDDSSEEES